MFGLNSTQTTTYFNPRPPCGGRHEFIAEVGGSLPISIHVPRVEDDAKEKTKMATKKISIHVPRVEDDEKEQGY